MSHLLSLPPELISEITVRLAYKDLKALSVVSFTTRQLVLPSLFRSVLWNISSGSQCIKEAHDEVNNAGTKIKHVIQRVLVIMPFCYQFTDVNRALALPIYVFQFLETLPKLSDIVIHHWTVRVRLQDLHFFPKIAKQTSLRHLSFSSEYGSHANGQPVSGPEGLESLSVKWHVADGQDPGSAMSHLYEFLRPSLGTLTCLELHDYPILKFCVLGPACTSLRKLKYTTYNQSPQVLETIAEMFPHVTDLAMLFQTCVWVDEFLEPLSSFRDLTHLTLSLDFEIAADDSLDEDHDFAWYRRCFFRRFRAAEEIAKVCPKLQRCNWIQLNIDSKCNDQEHEFVIREEAGHRVVKPVMQWWMANHYKKRHGGPLPDDMVKENAYWEQYTWQ
ncbi:hypothetical protein PILCRDRAFT_1065 [Piloderma croceum F 1598]|uniref:F-box domain-containing protein n=1 Tax=Piloderma croceum (strain F 1598) TaxID=765440 RepID=A0A0C3CMB1_PILCF|nr:hypothetical protein PILCRDRAFT_1065 [Piloderma croceum F 1598]